MSVAALIFDFDGVIADSEAPANRLLAEALTQLGLPTSYETALTDYCGKRWSDCAGLIEARLGCPLPEHWVMERQRELEAYGLDGLPPVGGVGDFLDAHSHLPKAVASSSELDWLTVLLARFGFDHHFGEHVYSAAGLARGKPHPDIYLNVASALNVEPAACVVIEDSPTGAAAGIAAGMTVIGLLAASHIRDGHVERLRAVGVEHMAEDYAAAGRLVAGLTG